VSDDTRDERGRFRPGVSGNPKGPARTVFDLSRAVREGVDPHELVRIALEIVRDPKAAARDRVAMWIALSDRGWIKPPSAHVVASVDATPSLPDAWNEMTAGERAAYLDARLRLALVGGDGVSNDRSSAQAIDIASKSDEDTPERATRGPHEGDDEP
jgi:hypothetical protein